MQDGILYETETTLRCLIQSEQIEDENIGALIRKKAFVFAFPTVARSGNLIPFLSLISAAMSSSGAGYP